MVVASGFSKVTGDLTDDEDDRQAMWTRAQTRFKKALEVYSSKGSIPESLRFFEDAEKELSPILTASGLTSLRERELEAVLKGRLHRAVIIAHLEDLPDRWSQVKSLVEDVLQFDYSNCHARWLRGLALLHGFQLRAEAKDEMQRAVGCSRQQNSLQQADQWQAEIESSFPSESLPEGSPAPASAPTESPAKPARTSEDSSRPIAAARKSSSAMKGGFFNKPSTKNANQRPSKAASEEVAAASSPAPAAAAVAAAATGPIVSSSKVSELEEELRALKESCSRRESELVDEARALRDQVSEDQRRHRDWRTDLSKTLDALGDDIEDGLGPEDEEEATNTEEVLRSLGGQVGEMKDRMSEDRSWVEASHQKYMDVATEVVTLREMCSQEMKERRDGARAHTSDIRDLKTRFGELKGLTKSLRDGLRTLLGPASGGNESDCDAGPDRVLEQAREFKALPASAKIGALLDDAAVLRVLLLFVMLGMLVALGLSVQIFGARRCRFACRR